MPHDLPRLRAAGTEAHTVDDVIETALEQPQHVVAGDAFHHRSLLIVVAELGFQNTVDAADFLLFAKLQPVSHGLFHLLGFAVLSGDKVTLFDGAFLGIAALTFEEKFHPLSSAKTTNRS